ncbi:hypothetical protein IWX49DRAFT_37981 [Phyllosticta citricarpa]
MQVEEARQLAINQPNSLQQPDVKRHAACDECRNRKLKCSGDKPRCGRCVRENITCIYSPQKQMGRPRKRRRDEPSSIQLPSTAHHHYGSSASSSNNHLMVNDAAAAAVTASPNAMGHMATLGNGYHGSYTSTPSAVSQQDLEVLAAGGGFDSGVQASNSAGAMMYSGFEGFSFNTDAAVAAEAAGGGEGMTGFGNVFELEPSFSLDPILGVFGDDDAGGGTAEGGRRGTPFEQSLSHSHSGQFSHEGTSAGGSGTCSRNLSIDGSSYHTPPLPALHHEQLLIAPPLQPQCACLSSMYLTLTSLHSLSSHEFPFVLPTLRSAINTIAAVIPCPQCPKRPVTATQNLHMLISLLLSVVESLRAALAAIDAEAARVEAIGATKALAMADAEMPMHMHTGTPDCPARFNMELSGPDWRTFVRKALRDQIVGSPQYPGERTLYGAVVSLENRQRRWHEDPELHRMRQKMFGEHAAHIDQMQPESRLCVKSVEQLRLAIDNLALSV